MGGLGISNNFSVKTGFFLFYRSTRFRYDGRDVEAGAKIEAIGQLPTGHKLAAFLTARNQSASATPRSQGVQSA